MEIAASPNPNLDHYYQTLSTYAGLGVSHEQGIRTAFRSLLETYAKPAGWTLVEEYALPGSRKRPDGTLLDSFRIPRGYWEAKDTKDDLEAEIKSKISLGYDLRNTIFEDTRRAVLYQNKQRVLEADLSQRNALAGLLTRYFNHSPAEIEDFHRAEREFREQIPSLAKGLTETIEKARNNNPVFVAAFKEFAALCRSSLNPGVTAGQIEEMLVQHLLTERLFRNVFDNPEFTRRNVIAAEIEKVIAALTSQSFSREAYLKQLDYFYVAIENTARTITDFSEKQGFLNTIYERFFQGFSTATADTHGIVYTPQPIVDFMCASVESVLQTEFGTTLSAEGVTVLDPCTGTGNFLVNLLRRVSPLDRERKYRRELFANEVMLLPYYVASLNIEHAYFDLQRRYEEFPGLCFADTLDMAQGQQLSLAFTEKNTERMQREQDAAITVIIGNPPYNVGQQNENDNNKNRRYGVIDDAIRATYVKDSKATLRTQVYDAYARFFRWATNRLEDRDGVICFVTNNGFLEGLAFDGFRKHLAQDFTEIYHLDLGGNARKRGGGSVFNIMVGVGITVLVRRREGMSKPYPPAVVKYHALDDRQNGAAKLAELKRVGSIAGLDWKIQHPDLKHNWLTDGLHLGFADFLPIGSKDTKASLGLEVESIFKMYSPGIKTDRDGVVYDFDPRKLGLRVQQFVQDYNDEVDRWKNAGRPKDVDAFVNYGKVKWSEHLKSELKREKVAGYDEDAIRVAAYRPFCKRYLYYSPLLNDRPGLFNRIFPTAGSEKENLVIWLKVGLEVPSYALITNALSDFSTQGGMQCFPLYTYALDGKIRRDNVTDWALAQFQAQYGPDVTKRDVFHYVYGLLHSPEYREKYKENLKRELPRVPLVEPTLVRSSPTLPKREGDEVDVENTAETLRPPASGGPLRSKEVGSEISPFRRFVAAGEQLAALHVGYETAAEYPLKQIVNPDVAWSWRVAKMKLNKDKTAVVVNDALTLGGVPPEVFGYTLGSRSALEWVLDQYQVSTDKRSGITTDPNRADDLEYIVRLVRRIVTVSVETMKIVASLPPLALPG